MRAGDGAVRLTSRVAAVAGGAMLLVAGCGPGDDRDSGDGVGGSCAGGREVVISVDDVQGDMELQHARSGGEVTEITIDWPDADAAGPASRPDFSPDGERLVVVRADGDYESAGPTATWLWTVAADGSGPRPLTDGAVYDDQPDWSPDGTTIAFSRSVANGPPRTNKLMVVDAAGDGEARPLFTDAAPDPGAGLVAASADHAPRWAPDGSRLAFLRHQWPPGEATMPTTSVMLVDADGTGVRELAPAHGAENLDWSPDGWWLLVSVPTSGRESTVQLVDTATGEAGPRIEDAAEAVWADDELLWYLRLDDDPGDLVNEFPLQQARLDGDRVEPVGDPVDVGASFLYRTLGLAVRPCA